MVDQETDLEQRVEALLRESLPAVDLLELTLLPADGGVLRLVVDHPDGVDHGVCAAVTGVLDEGGLLRDYGAEVWSPGPEPPLRTAEHFRRVVGRQVRVRAQEDGGIRSRTGVLVGADADGVRLRVGEDEHEIPLAAVRRANVIEDVEGGTA